MLCSERVGLVARTYHDIDDITNLLEEKERDLELAARIGQSLLKQNRSLTKHNEFLEEQLELAKKQTNTIVTETYQFEDQEELLMMECVEQFSAVSPNHLCGYEPAIDDQVKAWL
ncbi:hypothetical protein NDU88_005292 [Pleurodeles waltl]|uniref:HAP1 N-terminal domain-containing protein n=1 Tax=Pleurodeles waltl TaxID=8319 RepID=A0AAV7NR42_PLEWA|nr:hypothetical protein NDU88_005292 [Pleurodeles waltl]